jgi:hypothetical protein
MLESAGQGHNTTRNFSKYYCGDQLTDYEMDRTCRMNLKIIVNVAEIKGF